MGEGHSSLVASLGASRARHRGILEAPSGTSTCFPRVGTNTRVMFQENPPTKDLCDHMQTSTMSYPSLSRCPLPVSTDPPY